MQGQLTKHAPAALPGAQATISGHGQLLGETTAHFQDVPRAGQADVRSFCEAEPAGTLGTCGFSVTSPSRPQPATDQVHSG